MTTFPLSMETVRSQSNLLFFLQQLNRRCSEQQSIIDQLRRELSARPDDSLDVIRHARSELSSTGRYPLDVTGLHGQLAEVQPSSIIILSSDPTVAANGIDAAVYEVGQTATYNGAFYYVADGNPHTWQKLTLAGPTNMVTTDTAQTITADKTINAKLNVATDFEVASMQIQSFELFITNSAGTIKHLIASDGANNVLGNFAGKINAASPAYTATPFVNAAVAFAAGGGIWSAVTSRFVLDVAAQSSSNVLACVAASYNDTATAIIAEPNILSTNVNGVTRNRLEFIIRNATTGAGIDLTAIAAGKTIGVRFLGLIA